MNEVKRDKYFKRAEILGIIFILATAVFLSGFYKRSGGPLAVLVGSVNGSVWEGVKIFLVGFIVWGIIEALCIKPSFKRFVAAKVITLYAAGGAGLIIYASVNLIFEEPPSFLLFATAAVLTAIAQFVSFALYSLQKKAADYFLPMVFLLVLAVVMICCFSVFPPYLGIFKDPMFNMYGIIPEHIDAGAYVLDTIMFC
ncbi:MAG: DUF6512 family protein [Oscillospiraceae bacterium]|jgi:hypothetical protein|nr:DUF6512 family protein [Oscillospiraceae bacterium]